MPRAKKGPHETYVWGRIRVRPGKYKVKEKPETVEQRRERMRKWLQANYPHVMRKQ